METTNNYCYHKSFERFFLYLKLNYSTVHVLSCNIDLIFAVNPSEKSEKCYSVNLSDNTKLIVINIRTNYGMNLKKKYHRLFPNKR